MRVFEPSVDREYTEAHHPNFKACYAAMAVAPWFSVVTQNDVRKAVFFKNTGKNGEKFFITGSPVRIQAK